MEMRIAESGNDGVATQVDAARLGPGACQRLFIPPNRHKPTLTQRKSLRARINRIESDQVTVDEDHISSEWQFMQARSSKFTELSQFTRVK